MCSIDVLIKVVLFPSIFSFWLKIMEAGWILEQGTVFFLPPLHFLQAHRLILLFIYSELL